jgi:hypothetical protein
MQQESTSTVILTVDVEAFPYRAHRDPLDTLIWGKAGDEEYGIGMMMDIADKYNVHLVFFLDYGEFDIYGQPLLDVGREIIRRGHDLQVHLHPDFIAPAFFTTRGLQRHIDMYTAPQDIAKALILHVLDLHLRVSPLAPIAFRGGSFRYNRHILEALRDCGFLIDSSHSAHNYSAKSFTPKVHRARSLSAQYRWDVGIAELPVSCLPYFRAKQTLAEYHFLLANTNDLVEAHVEYLDNYFTLFGIDAVAVMVLHSWNFFNWDVDEKKFTTPNPSYLKKFDELLNFITNKYCILSIDKFVYFKQPDFTAWPLVMY